MTSPTTSLGGAQRRLPFDLHPADYALTLMITLFALNFIVVKDAVSRLDPLVFHAIRFSMGLPLMLGIAWRTHVPLGRISRRDLGLIIALTVFGGVLFQVLFGFGIRFTTSTNTALLLATMPTWTALIAVALGRARLGRALLMGIAASLLGVALVILSGGGAELRFSHDDLVGSGLILSCAVIGALSASWAKPIIDRTGAMPYVVWAYIVTAVGMVIVASPQLITLDGDDLPLRYLPHIMFAGMIVSIAGFTIWHYALEQIGPARASTYHNFTPILTAIAGVLLLSEPLSGLLLIGGALTLGGVIVVRRSLRIVPANAASTTAADAAPSEIAPPEAAPRSDADRLGDPPRDPLRDPLAARGK